MQIMDDDAICLKPRSTPTREYLLPFYPQLHAYPNPSLDALLVEVSIPDEKKLFGELQIFTCQGLLTRSLRIKDNTDAGNIRLSDLDRGCYFIRFIDYISGASVVSNAIIISN